MVHISNASKVMLKILQARLQQYMTRKLSEIQAGLRQGRGTRDQIANIHWITENAREFQKNLYFSFTDYAKAFDFSLSGLQQTVENSSRDRNILPASWETCMQVKKQQLEPDMEQWTGSKLGKEYVKAVHCHPAYLTYMQSTSCETLGWMNHMLKSWWLGEIPITSDTQMTPS